MENDCKILYFDAGINNLEDLANYLNKNILKKYAKDSYFHIEEINDDYILGCIDGARFILEFEKRQRMSLEMSEGFPVAKQKIVSVLNPIMRHVDENANNPEFFTGPLVSYRTKTPSEVVEWETFDPMKKLTAIAFDYYSGANEDISDLQIFYPETTIETLKEDIKYGNFTGCIESSMVEKIKNFAESELYLYIKGTLDIYEKYDEASKLLGVEAEEKLDMAAYLLCFLMQQTKRFGVKTNPPSMDPVDPTIEQLAWIRWWSEKLNETAEKAPETFNNWDSFPSKIDPNFKPEGDFRELIEKVREGCPLFENEKSTD